MTDLTDERLRAWYAPLAAREPADRSACPAPEVIQALVDREGEESARLAVLDHVMTCGPCRYEFDLLNTATRPNSRLHGRLSERSWRHRLMASRPARWTATAIAASIVAVISVQSFRHRALPDVVRGARAAVGLDTTQFAVQLIAPVAADAATAIDAKSLTFVWHATPGALVYTIEVLDTNGIRVLGTSTPDTAVTFPGTTRLLRPRTPYQWWVRAVSPSGVDQRSEIRALRLRAP
jgi:hypothetical protein